MRRRAWRTVVGAILGWMLVGGAAYGQYSHLQVRTLAGADRLDAAVQDVRAGNVETALPVLRDLTASSPALVSASEGAAAYWLGDAYARLGQTAQAESTWTAGVEAVVDAGRFDVRLADAYVRSLSPQRLRGHRLFAADVFTHLMGRVRPDAPDDEQAIFRRHLAQIAPMMDDDVFDDVVTQPRNADPETWTFEVDAGTTLQSWWRRLDPLPATLENERVEEHLTRLATAQTAYACPERTGALDDRGHVYLRYGAPARQHEVSFNDGEFIREVYRFGVNVNPRDFPQNELWLYPHISDSGYYLFAEERRDCYDVASANDLLPSHLQQYRGNTDRGMNIAYSAMIALRHIYRELALYHVDYGARYSSIESYVSYQETQAVRAETAEALGTDQGPGAGPRHSEVGTGAGQTRYVFSDPMMGVEPPTQFVASMVAEGRRASAAAARRRDTSMPTQHTDLLDDVGTLPVAVRTARFLTPSGATRTEVSWGLSTRGLVLRVDDAVQPSMLTVAAVRYGADYRQEQAIQQQHPVTVRDLKGPLYVGPTLRLDATTSVTHLGLQWAQYGVDRGREMTTLGRRERLATARADSLAPLSNDPGTLEMSDVQVLLAPADTAAALVDPTANGIPYPFAQISSSLPLMLYFEAYHLTYGPDDRTRYTVTYEVEGRTRRGWTRLFRGTDPQRTATSTTVEGTSRRSEEVILLDLSQIERDDTQDVRVTVRVTDEVTGQTVSRDVDFVLQ